MQPTRKPRPLGLAPRSAGPTVLLVCYATLACGQSGEPVAKDHYHLFHPTPRNALRDLSTDRPDTTESPYTVDAGHFQLELSFVDFTVDHRNENSQTTRAFAAAPMLLKVGLCNSVDLQVGIDPYTRARTIDRPTRTHETAEGFGDTIVRLKKNLWGNDGGETAFALMPFVKFPTADNDLGNEQLEGGLIAPLGVGLPNDFSLGLMAEFDLNRDGEDDRYVLDFVHTATVSHDIVGDLAGYVEYAGFANLHDDEEYRGYFDAGITFGWTIDLQLDAGTRIGLTEASDDLGFFVGLSVRL
ncbi:MAG: transporter [Planctomycetota bacterium]